jgi:RNA polymerase-binding transcription factor DksA
MRPKPNLSRGQLHEFERVLRSARARLERAMARTRAHRIALRMRGTAAPHEVARPSGRITLSPRTLARHQELLAAIRRLETGTFGVCLRCTAPIEYERLVSDAKVTHCAECTARVTSQGDASESPRSITRFEE